MKLKQPIKKIIAKLERSLLIKIGLGFAALFVILLVLALIFGSKRKPANVAPTPTPKVIPTEEISRPSLYATDAAILEIESRIKDIDQKLQEVDLKETALNPPVLDFEIKF
ncbi:MAG: hypothetical protein ABH807_01675 [Candidatus Shapirobacteria bacterium]